jgi:hypothetical protein
MLSVRFSTICRMFQEVPANKLGGFLYHLYQNQAFASFALAAFQRFFWARDILSRAAALRFLCLPRVLPFGQNQARQFQHRSSQDSESPVLLSAKWICADYGASELQT